MIDENPQGVIATVSGGTLMIKSVPDMSGATKYFNTRKAKDRGDTTPGEFYPGTYHPN